MYVYVHVYYKHALMQCTCMHVFVYTRERTCMRTENLLQTPEFGSDDLHKSDIRSHLVGLRGFVVKR